MLATMGQVFLAREAAEEVREGKHEGMVVEAAFGEDAGGEFDVEGVVSVVASTLVLSCAIFV